MNDWKADTIIRWTQKKREKRQGKSGKMCTGKMETMFFVGKAGLVFFFIIRRSFVYVWARALIQMSNRFFNAAGHGIYRCSVMRENVNVNMCVFVLEGWSHDDFARGAMCVCGFVYIPDVFVTMAIESRVVPWSHATGSFRARSKRTNTRQ